MSIGANNSFGASVFSEYVMYVGEKLTPEGKVVDDYYWLRDGNLKSSNVNNTSQARILRLKNLNLMYQKNVLILCLMKLLIIFLLKNKLIP